MLRRVLSVLLAFVLAGYGSQAGGSDGERSVSVPWRIADPSNPRDRQLELLYTAVTPL